MKKNLLSILVAICLVVSTIPISVVADEENILPQESATTGNNIIDNDIIDNNIIDNNIIDNDITDDNVANSNVADNETDNSETTSNNTAYSKEKNTTFIELGTADEFKSAISAGQNVKIINDFIITEFIPIPQGSNVTIDLNGNTISRKVITTNDTGILVVANNASLTVLDSGSGGKLENTANNGIGIVNGSNLTILSGTIEATGITIYNTSNMKISGGEIYSTMSGSTAVWNDSGNVEISGGKVYTTMSDSTAVCNVSGNVEISGGTIKSMDTAVYNNEGRLQVSDGTIYTTMSGGVAVWNYSGDMELSSGEIYAEASNAIAIISTNASTLPIRTLKISGGKVWHSGGSSASAIVIDNVKTEITGGDIYSRAHNTTTIKYSGDATSTPLKILGNANVWSEGEGTSTIFFTKGKMEISGNANVWATDSQSKAIQNLEQGTIDISQNAKVISSYAGNYSGTIHFATNVNTKITVSDSAIVSNIAKNGARYAIYFFDATSIDNNNYTNNGGTVGAIYPINKEYINFSGLQSIGTVTYNGSPQVGYTGSIVTDYTGEIALTYYLIDGITKTTTANSGANSLGGAPKNPGEYILVYGVAENTVGYTGMNSITFTIVKQTSSGGGEDYFDTGSQTVTASGSNSLAVAQTSPWQIISGANQTTVNSSSPELTIICNLPFNLFKSLRINGVLLNTNYYTAKAGSTIVTINPAYLATLPAGKHTIEFVGTDGSATTTYFYISTGAGTTVNPSTGAKI